MANGGGFGSGSAFNPLVQQQQLQQQMARALMKNGQAQAQPQGGPALDFGGEGGSAGYPNYSPSREGVTPLLRLADGSYYYGGPQFATDFGSLVGQGIDAANRDKAAKEAHLAAQQQKMRAIQSYINIERERAGQAPVSSDSPYTEREANFINMAFTPETQAIAFELMKRRMTPDLGALKEYKEFLSPEGIDALINSRGGDIQTGTQFEEPSVLGAEDGIPVLAQRNTATGEYQPVAKGGGTSVNVNTGGENAGQDSFVRKAAETSGTKFAEMMGQIDEKQEALNTAIADNNRARELLEQGLTSGALSDWRIRVGMLGQLFGFPVDIEKYGRDNEYRAIIKRKAMSNRLKYMTGPTSDKDIQILLSTDAMPDQGDIAMRNMISDTQRRNEDAQANINRLREGRNMYYDGLEADDKSMILKAGRIVGNVVVPVISKSTGDDSESRGDGGDSEPVKETNVVFNPKTGKYEFER